ncbi:MAG: hypothetical protein U5K69_13710 [Balneolaceae bacterium]|nr:hypothetical protein [Balneolaceae bacterium]
MAVGGLISPGQQSNITLNLDPGSYVMSCFIPSANGHSHRSQGMVRPITVTERSPRETAPEEDVMITSSGHDITQEGKLGFGQQTVAFHVEKPPADSINPYSGMSLAQLTDPMDQQEDLRDFEPNPPSIPILGGALAIPPGDTAYVSVKLTVPGPYSLVFTNMEDQPKLREFVVK